ncbi:hypothetical protein C2G38_2156298 [Gigaspora rosea]|uniref:Uncharacterized protein n=1 Tax=Gigaspora rosea TaxID=44941 RepID=A0A397W2W3_9GLOM|nr:hypothetical protein C2G38_2156298 [Gigaspora rosea]
MTNKAYDSSNKVSRKNPNEASDTNDVEHESWVDKAGQKNEGIRGKANNLDVVSVKIGNSLEDFERAEEHIQRYAEFKGFNSSNEVSRKNPNEASDTNDVEHENWVDEAGQENKGSKAGEASEGSVSSFEALSHNRGESNNLDVVSVKIGDPFEDFKCAEEHIQ